MGVRLRATAEAARLYAAGQGTHRLPRRDVPLAAGGRQLLRKSTIYLAAAPFPRVVVPAIPAIAAVSRADVLQDLGRDEAV